MNQTISESWPKYQLPVYVIRVLINPPSVRRIVLQYSRFVVGPMIFEASSTFNI